MNVRSDPSQFDATAKVLKFPVTPHASRKIDARSTNFWFIGSLATMIVMLAGAVVALWAIDASDAVHYVATPVSRGSITRTIAASGTVKPQQTIAITASTSGVVQSLSCDYNTEVKAGQICAKIDPRPYLAQLDQFVGQLHRDQAVLDKDRVLLARYQQPARHNAMARPQAEDQALVVRQDEATVELDQGLLEGATLNLGYTDIVSPMDGTVVSRNVSQGQTVAADSQTPALFVIASDLKTMQIDAQVSEADIGGIAEKDSVSFTADAFPKRVFQGAVSQIRQSPQTVQNAVTYDVVISFGNSDRALKPGMTATARLVTAQRTDIVRVPNEALRYAPKTPPIASGSPWTVPEAPPDSPSGRRQIWVLRDGALAPVAVGLGPHDDGFTEIVSGDLKPGEQVVTGEQSAARR